MINSNHYCVIMAGGIGSRFWPLSRTEKPKQFIDALGIGKTFIQMTYERFTGIIPKSNFLVVTGESYKSLVLEQLSELSEDQVLTEPCRRNTAPCIAYAMYRLKKINPNAIAIVTPSDQYIANQKDFEKVIHENLSFAATNDALLTIGITPTFPATGYGYIQAESADAVNTISSVVNFKEKPDVQTALQYLSEGNYYWNSGIFIWSVSAITKTIHEFLPNLAVSFSSIQSKYLTNLEQQAVNTAFEESQSISIDYGIMEKAPNVFVYCSNALGWSDVGTWNALYELSEKDENRNTKMDDNVLYYSCNNMLVKKTNPGKLIVVEGLNDYLVADTEDVLLICRKINVNETILFKDQIK